MSRADGGALPRSPRLGGALRAAAVDFYFHSIRLVTANVIWGAGFMGLFALWVVGTPLILLAAPLLAIPWSGIVRLAALISRGEDVVLSDAFEAYRRYLVPSVVAGFAVTLATFVFVTNVAVGVSLGGPPGWAFATLAGWGVVITWLVALCFWPLLVDPRRVDLRAIDKARLAGLLVLAFPLRIGAVGLVVALIAAVSIVAIAAIATVSAAYAALVTCRYVLPAADRLEGRRSVPVVEEE